MRVSPPRAPRRLTIGTFFAMHAPLAHELQLGVTQFATEHGGIELRRWDFKQWPRPRMLAALGLDGIVTQMFPRIKPVSLRDCRIPIVNVSYQSRTCSLPRIGPDEIGIGDAVAGYFLRRGYRHFAYCGHPWHWGSHLRRKGFADRVAKSGFAVANFDLVPHPEEVSVLTFVREFRRNLRWLRALPRPCAVMAFNDEIAAFVLRNALEVGLRVPQEIAVMGVDNVPFRTHQTPVSISSVDVGFAKVGYRAMAALVRHLEHPAEPLRDATVRAFKIVSRQSTEAWAAEDEVVCAALEFMEEHRAGRVHVPEIARAVGVSRRVLERRVRKELGTSVYSVLQQARVSVAQNLLDSTALPLKEVATAAGFRSAQHLAVAFRAKVDTTPSGYRAQRRLAREP